VSEARPPPPPPLEELDRILRAQDWGSLRARLFRFAFRVTRARARAEELADAVLVDCCDPQGAPWNPNAGLGLVVHALRTMRSRLSAERKKHLVRTDPRTVAAVRDLAAPARTPEDRLDDAERRARTDRIVAAARARLSGRIDRGLLDLSLDGVDRPADQAARLGLPIEDIRRARERVKYALRVSLDEDEAASWTPASGHPKRS
jgi:hypothetical protein